MRGYDSELKTIRSGASFASQAAAGLALGDQLGPCRLRRLTSFITEQRRPYPRSKTVSPLPLLRPGPCPG